MQCIKCGRETADKHVFCDQCLSGMEGNPVKPGTPVVIPKRPAKQFSQPAVKKEKPEEQILKMQNLIRFLCWLCVGLALALGICIGLIVHHYATNDHNAPAIGQNYSTEAPDDAPLSR